METLLVANREDVTPEQLTHRLQMLAAFTASAVTTVEEISQQPPAKARRLVPNPKIETIGRLTAAHQPRL